MTKNIDSTPEKIRVNLYVYNEMLGLDPRHRVGTKPTQTPSALHSRLIRFNDAFDKNLGNHKEYITIRGCEVPIYFVLSEDSFTFVCRSKVLRGYLFCLLVNYVFDNKFFRFDMMAENFNFSNYLNEKRMVALQNVLDLIKTMPPKDFAKKLTFNNYYFDLDED